MLYIELKTAYLIVAFLIGGMLLQFGLSVLFGNKNDK